MRVQALMTASELEQAGYGANRVAMTGGAEKPGVAGHAIRCARATPQGPNAGFGGLMATTGVQASRQQARGRREACLCIWEKKTT